MVSEELSNEMHQRLIAERERLQDEIAGLTGGAVSGAVFAEDETDSVDQHQADDASELFEREKNMTVLRTLEINVQQIDDALTKFDAGTYGVCERCGKPIPEKRLRALPEATHCIECQTILERQSQAASRL